jgi:hypothetical protein
MSAHNPSARAEARVERAGAAAPDPAALDVAAAGAQRHRWQPVRGPHLRVVRTRHARNTTGVVGISLTRTAGRRYYAVQLGSRSVRKFNITTLGHAEAWRRALRARAAHETAIRSANTTILAARQTHTIHNIHT